ncbi:ATP-binding protein [Actinoplanes missouriensis]|nr:ATP-binding protein [Actinoplanes missouriensis]
MSRSAVPQPPGRDISMVRRYPGSTPRRAGPIRATIRPPYLFERYDPGQGDGIDVGLDVEASVVTLSVHGTWGLGLCRTTDTAIRKCLSEHPSTLLINLHALTDPDGSSAAMWMATRRRAAAMNPGVRTILCAQPGTALVARLHRLGIIRLLPVFDTLAAARTATTNRQPLTDRIEMRLEPHDRAAATAREAVTGACSGWQLAHLGDRARLIISELVLNAVEHAGTAVTVILSRRGDGLHIAVRDDNPCLPQLRDDPPNLRDTPPFRRGTGLHVVHAAATAWGAMPTTHGKVVWATLRSWARP